MRAFVTALYLLVGLLLPATLWAACDGRDLRPTLSDAEQAALAARMDGKPYATGNRWRAEKDGQVLDIIGTLHLSDPRFDPVMARLAPVIAAADLIYVEATPEDQKELLDLLARSPDKLFLTDGPSLIDRLPPDDWARLRDAASARGVPGVMAAKMQPWYLSLLLALPPCITRDMAAGAKGLDHRIIETARGAGVPVRAIEPYDTLLTLMGSDPIEEQIEMLQVTIATPTQSEDGMATLSADYFEERHTAAIETAGILARRWLDLPDAEIDRLFDEMIGTLVDARNVDWMEVIRATDAPHVLIAVGAGHLGGEMGLLNLLAQDGYALRPQPF